MPRIGLFTFDAWEGGVQMPTDKGSRRSMIRTSALVTDAATGWLLATQYAALVNAGGSVEIETNGGTPIAGVRIAALTITSLHRVKVRSNTDGPRTHQVDASWELYV